MPGSEEYDLIVVGAGPGGYVAAARAAELGMKTACVEKEPRPGGVCLNVGCIPSKALLESSGLFALARSRLKEHGIRIGDVSADLRQMMDRKDKIVTGLSDNVRKLLEDRRVRLINGTARLRPDRQVEVRDEAGNVTVHRGTSILLATGSEPVTLPFLPGDGKTVISSTEALALESVPKRFGIVGGGYIGLELGSVWARLGSDVTVIEMLPGIAQGLDGQVSRRLDRFLRRQGLKFRLRTRVTRSEKTESGIKLVLQTDGKEDETEFDKVLVAVGRKPRTRGLGLEELGIRLDPGGFVVVDEKYRTTVPGVYAVGDLVPGPMLAHKASAEGAAVVDGMAGLSGEVDYDAIPCVVYTFPEVAAVGKSEEELKKLGIEYRAGTFPFAGTGRARCIGETDGFAKLLAHARSGRILGAHIIGPWASELIAECVLAMRFHLKAEDLSRTIHAHPTLSEALHESASAIRK